MGITIADTVEINFAMLEDARKTYYLTENISIISPNLEIYRNTFSSIYMFLFSIKNCVNGKYRKKNINMNFRILPFDCIEIFPSIIVQSNFVSVTKHLVGPSSNGTEVKMVKEIEFHVTEKFVQVIMYLLGFLF